MKIGTVYSGGAGAEIGAAWAGAESIWGIEWDNKIADVARLNGFVDVITHDARCVEYELLAAPDWIHGSPPCVRASNANQLGESPEDMELAIAFLSAIMAHRPRRLSLENVRGYKHFEAYKYIYDVLRMLGYHLAEAILNSADYGTPQTRERLFLIGSLDGPPAIPARTHTSKPASTDQLSMFDVTLPRWRGWLDAIADLIPELPDSELAPWQMERMPAEIRESLIIGSLNVTSDTKREASDPMFTVTSNMGEKGMPRALIVDGTLGHDGTHLATREGDDPMWTVTANFTKRMTRALLIYPTEMRDNSKGMREGDDPAFTLLAQSGRSSTTPRALLIGGGNTNTTEGRDRPPRFAEDPAYTVTASSDRDRIVVSFVTKKITPPALARFNGLRAYRLPSSNRIAARVIGNMVMPDVMKAIILANPL
jgi:DNA (cytosine-5)-methyltransferase 1